MAIRAPDGANRAITPSINRGWSALEAAAESAAILVTVVADTSKQKN